MRNNKPLARKVYVYINTFEYKDKGMAIAKDLNNHPKERHAYKASKQLIPGGKIVYKLEIPKKSQGEDSIINGIILMGLKGEDTQISWDADEVTFNEMMSNPHIENFNEIADLETSNQKTGIDEDIDSVNALMDMINGNNVEPIKHEMIEDAQQEQEDDNFIKYDEEKSRVDLIPSDVLLDVGYVLLFGAKKYDEDNWKKCKEPNQYIAACLRHIYLHNDGEVFDSESGLTHLSHAITSLMMGLWIYKDINQNNDI